MDGRKGRWATATTEEMILLALRGRVWAYSDVWIGVSDEDRGAKIPRSLEQDHAVVIDESIGSEWQNLYKHLVKCLFQSLAAGARICGLPSDVVDPPRCLITPEPSTILLRLSYSRYIHVLTIWIL